MKHVKPINTVLLFCLLFFTVVYANAIEEEQIPDVLKPWKAWVLHDHPDLFCPIAASDANTRYCLWPSQLDLTVDQNQAEFRQRWTVYAKGWVMLPGGKSLWPEAVKANNEVVPVTVRNDRPGTFLEAGEYLITGKIHWKERPEFLEIPVHTAIVSLILDGNPVEQKNISSDGKLWFGRTGFPQAEENVIDTVKAQVFRKLNDGIPMTLETELRLAISGNDRELRLGKLLPDGTLPYRFESPLPARLDPDGRLRMQVRAGEWTVRLSARFTEPVTEFQMSRMEDTWPEREIWVFAADRSLRTVTLEGARGLDPQQTLLPDSWKSFPVYLMEPTTRLILKEQLRGDVGTAGNQLILKREFWLDFDGKGYTIRDNITGTLNQGWRMSMQPGHDLGRVDLNGQPQVVTRMGEDGQRGVEVRQGILNLTAISRFEGSIDNISPVGWNHDVSNLNLNINLPPGWELLYARGADIAMGSWIQKWNLWDLFLVLIITVSLGRVINPVWGAITGVVLCLIYHESDAPRYIWLNLAAVLALLKVLPQGRARKAARIYHFLCLFFLVLISLNFAVDQVKMGLYPQLENERSMGYSGYNDYNGDIILNDSEIYVQSGNLEFNADQTLNARVANASVVDQDFIQASNGNIVLRSVSKSEWSKKGLAQDYKAKIQTGPGRPEWNWNKINLSWNGPLAKDEELRLAFIPPSLTRTLRFLRVILLFVLTGALFLFTFGGSNRWPRLKTFFLPGTLAPIILLCFLVHGTPTLSAGDSVPNEQVLKKLEKILTEPPPDPASAASITRGQLNITERKVLFRLEIHAATMSAIPLPGHRDLWMPETVLVEDKPAVIRHDDAGQLLISLPRGVHDVILQGVAIGDDLRFPVIIAAHNLKVDAPGWNVSGVIDGQSPGRSIHLNRIDKAKEKEEDVLLPDPIQPFVRVERTLNLGMEWYVHTRVVRVAPIGTAINMHIPALPDALIVSPNIKHEEGIVQVVMQPDQGIFEWDSLLKIEDQIKLHSKKDQSSWTEVWTLHCSSIWHFDYEGITEIKKNTREGDLSPTWKPWPGETLVIGISRPEAVEGRTRTIENIKVVSRPGSRVTDNELNLNIRSSQGGDYIFQIDDGAIIQSLSINRIEQMISGESGEIKVPLNPGVQNVQLKWQEDHGIALKTVTPEIDFKEPVSNINLTINLPANRWILLTGGPTIGPAVLYWGVLAVIIIIAFGLSRYRAIPLKIHQWLLLLIGLSTVNSVGGIVVVLWLIVMAARKNNTGDLPRIRFNFVQVMIFFLTIAAIISLLATIPMSLLSRPDMQIAGNASYGLSLNWYHDRSLSSVPAAWVITIPIWCYRLTMLFWSLWMVFALTDWIKWGWQCFSDGSLWKVKAKKEAKKQATPPATPVTPEE